MISGSGWIIDIKSHGQDKLWVGKGEGGASLYDLNTDTVIHFSFNANNQKKSLGDNRIQSLYEDTDGILWVGTLTAGLDRLEPTTGNITHFTYDSTDSTSLSQNRVTVLFEDQGGGIWAGTPAGLNRLNKETNSFTRYTSANSDLPENAILGIVDDEVGNLWVTTPNALTQFNPGATGSRVFRDLKGAPYNERALHRGRSGRIYIGGANGVDYFAPEQLLAETSTYEPDVVLTDFSVFDADGQEIGEETLSTTVLTSNSATLAHNQNAFTFTFAALHYKDPENNQHQYMLEGYDPTWRQAGSEREAAYVKVPPGTYTFRVRATGSDGARGESQPLIITVLPPWWRTKAMFLVYGFLFLVGIYGVDRLQRRQLTAREREKARERELAHAREIEQAYTQLKSTQQQLIQQEKMASLGQLTSGIAHEIKNPLNFVNNFAELNTELLNELESNPDSRIGDVLETIHAAKINAQQIAKHGKRADRIVQSMMEHAGGKGERYEVAINPLVEEFATLTYSSLQARIPDLEVEIEKELDEQVGSLVIAPQDIGRVLQNILVNAFEAVHDKSTRAGGDYVPRVHIKTVHRENAAEIRISDNGVGIPQKALDRVFEPFFTTKPTGSGTGLGLSLSYDIVTQGHGGSLEVESTEGEGATFVVRLPA